MNQENPFEQYLEGIPFKAFWEWFKEHAEEFRKVVLAEGDVENDFFNKMDEPLSRVKENIFCLVGVMGDDTVDLIFTPDGMVKNIVFVEQLVAAAPSLDGWNFQALKPPMDINDMGISMGGMDFSTENLSFYSEDYEDYPDEINITVVHNDFTEEEAALATNGTYIFIDNYIGELSFVNTVDSLSIIGPAQAEKELVPINKLKDFLKWRQKEFVEKYEATRYDTASDEHTMYEAKTQEGNPVVAVMNTSLLHWDKQSSHPWIATVGVHFDGSENNGMPNQEQLSLMNEFEDEFMQHLKDFEGYLNVGRQTGAGTREIHFACKEFRKPPLVLNHLIAKYAEQLEFSLELYKDKYWRSFSQFMPY